MIQALWDWVSAHEELTAVIAGISLLTFIGSLSALPFLAARIPSDYFVDPQRHQSRLKKLHPAVFVILVVLKNILGWLLIASGLAMLVLPGQGLLTILIGLILSDFPGKFRFERWFACRRSVFRAINWLRQRAGHQPLEAPKRPDGSDCASQF